MAQKDPKLMTIGQVANEIGVAATTLRYYEREGFLTPTVRSGAGYRLYDGGAIQRLRFIRAAQAVGFTLEDIRTLLLLDDDTPCREVQQLLERRIAEVNEKIIQLRKVQATLGDALQRCCKSKKGCAVLVDLRSDRKVRKRKVVQ